MVDRSDPTRPVAGGEVLAAAAGPLPGGGTVGAEPGGQLELTTERLPDARTALDAADADEDELRRRLAVAGLVLVATGMDPWRLPRRSLDLPRYRAMEAAFDARGPAGRVMMCSTAALQVNLDFGADPVATCSRAALVAPVLAAAFANSPRLAPDGTVIASARALVWAAVDPALACSGVDDPWALVSTGLADPGMRAAAEALLALAADLLGSGAPGDGAAVRTWAEHRAHAGWSPTSADLQSVHHLEQETH